MRDSANGDQAILDLEDARLRLDRLHAAIVKRDEAEALVRSLQAQLRNAKRKAKEAGWNLSSLIAAERRR